MRIEKKRHKHKRPALSARETTRLRQGTDCLVARVVRRQSHQKLSHIPFLFGDKDIRHHIRICWENTESFLLPSLQITQTNRLKLPDSANKWLRMPELLQSGGRRWILRRTNSCLGMVSTTNSFRPLVFHEDCLAPKDCVLVGGH